MEKIKHFIESEKGKDILIVVIVILVGLGSFELGRLSKGHPTSGIKMEYPNQSGNQAANMVAASESITNLSENFIASNSATAASNKNVTGKTFFASNRGSKYYSIGCSAGKSLKLENRVYFATKE